VRILNLPDKKAVPSLNTHTPSPTHTLIIGIYVNIGLNYITDQMGLSTIFIELSHRISHLKCDLKKKKPYLRQLCGVILLPGLLERYYGSLN